MIGGEPPRSQFDLHFSVFGVPVRVHPLFWLMGLILGAINYDPDIAGASVAIWVVVVFVSVLVHELGHAFTMRAYGEEPHVVLYVMGGLAISGRSAWSSGFAGKDRTPLQQVIISAAGPGAGFVLAGVTLLVAVVTFNAQTALADGNVAELLQSANNRYLITLFFALLVVNIFWGIINLMPVYPLDGGQIARAVLTAMDPWNGVRYSLMLSIVAGAILAGLGLMSGFLFLAFLYGSLAFSSWQMLNQITRGGGGFGGGGFGGGWGGGGGGGRPW